MVTLKVNNVDKVLARMIFALSSEFSKEELVYTKMYELSENGIYHQSYNKRIQSELKMNRQNFFRIMQKLQNKKLIFKNEDCYILETTLKNKNINQLTLIKTIIK